MEFKEVKLGEISNINMGQSPKSEFYSEFGGTPFLQGNRTFQHIYPLIDTYTNKITKLANKNDILFSVRAPVGDMNIAPVDLCIGRGLCAINSTNSNQEFLFYLLKSKLNELESHSTGTIFSSVNKKTLENFIVKVPSDSHQKNIGRLLSNLDKKIEINQNIIANLEELSQTLFKRWFVDFEFPDENENPYKSSGGKMIDSELGEMPELWSVKNINELLKIYSGYAFKSKWWSDDGYNVIKIKDINNNSIDITGLDKVNEIYVEKASNFKVYGGEILIALTGATAGKLGIVPKLKELAFVNQRVGLITSNIDNVYIYHLLKSDRIRRLTLDQAIGSAQANISPVKFGSIKILWADEKTIDRYCQLTRSNYEKIVELYSENNDLIQLRDTLLPKLMSGEIEIPDDIEVNEDELSI
ncbi:restriction endonuclease subunit S [Staphylococcus equorum]|uniref:restriction endonuclease subunit S n=1 Tax=Staphylococcus equorum TaxID=246432 RepID=UPI002DB81C14|nr:restriction endonuclease subunit S [Staphylococcus equorum]MEB7722025.1 restriction endonuclease subunit S [Staphylococcus equorum]